MDCQRNLRIQSDPKFKSLFRLGVFYYEESKSNIKKDRQLYMYAQMIASQPILLFNILQWLQISIHLRI